MRTAILILMLACDAPAPDCPVPNWQIEAVRPSEGNAGAVVTAQLGPDGSVIVVIADATATVRFGGTLLDGMHIARVSPDGADMTIEPAGVGGYVYGRPLGVDSSNRPVVVWGVQEPTLVGYSAALGERWRRTIHCYGVDAIVAVAPTGEVAYRECGPSMSAPSLRLLDPDGVERWHVDGVLASRLGFLPNGDVVSFEPDDRRVVRRANDGSFVSERASALPALIAADGGSLVATYVPDARYELERYAQDGVLVWSKSIVANISPLGVVFATNGDVIVGTPEIARLESATGEELSRVSLCEFPTLVGGDDHSVVVLSVNGSPARGLERYEN